MTTKGSDKSIARWIQATVITFVLYLMMGMSQSQSASTIVLSAWRSSSTPAEVAPVFVEAPTLPLLPK